MTCLFKNVITSYSIHYTKLYDLNVQNTFRVIKELKGPGKKAIQCCGQERFSLIRQWYRAGGYDHPEAEQRYRTYQLHP